MTYLSGEIRERDAAIDSLRFEKADVERQLSAAQAEAAATSSAHLAAVQRERDGRELAVAQAEARVADAERQLQTVRTSLDQQLAEVRADLARERERAGDAQANAHQQMLVLQENCNDSQAQCGALQERIRQYESAQANLRSESDQLRVRTGRTCTCIAFYVKCVSAIAPTAMVW